MEGEGEEYMNRKSRHSREMRQRLVYSSSSSQSIITGHTQRVIRHGKEWE